jgi:2-(1,2-epoxy-1,2-dihydrophenyl)acetyl-CoA isomerase
MSEDVLSSIDEHGIVTITLNREATKNSITEGVSRLLQEAVEDAEMNPDARVVVVTGAGKAFCSGGNFKGFGSVDTGNPMAMKYSGHPLWNEIETKSRRFQGGSAKATELLHTIGKPTIAMLRGPAVGAGVGLAAACDFRFASDTAFFMPGYIRVGISPDFGTSYYVTKLVGPAMARHIFFLGDRIDAAEALRIGLVSRVIPDDQLEAETMAYARQLAKQAPVALFYTKQSLNAAETQHLRDVHALEARNFARCFQTEDAKEAVRAFIDKREPEFKGR